MRTVFFGTSGFAATVLPRLAANAHRPALVVTPPDSRRGRGRRLAAPPAAEAARELGIELLQAASVNESDIAARIRSAEAEIGAVCAFGQLIKDPLLAELELLNVHPSLLPRWRGAAPIERAIMTGDAETGVSIMRLTEGLDSGPVGLQERVAIDPVDDFGALEPRLAELGGELLVSALDFCAEDRLELAEQDDGLATYSEKIESEDRHLDPSRSAAELERRVRALTPHVGAHLELEPGERFGVCAAEVWQPRAEDQDAPELRLEPGELAERDGALLLGTGEGILRLASVQPPGRKAMPADAYLRGHPLSTAAR